MKCSICNFKSENVISIGKSPIANSLLSKKELLKEELFYPLDLCFCSNCFLLEVSYKVNQKKYIQ